ncbi:MULTISPECIES: aminodeoxychorismate synthase component I [Cysteiniphilum]|uniref:aminodeoxychorismate synthase component I n=1 Tax=Cysteiniphilum TaxID=2056696 RepID=UPI0017806005|nr:MULTISPECIES: aminodeoxychorismate synthase component I [Cysteiniphilum]
MPNNHLPPFAYLENTLDSSDKSFYFSKPHSEVLCTDPKMLKSAFAKLAELQQQGLYLVGFISYEAAYYLNPDFTSLKTASQRLNTPLLHFIAFEQCSPDLLQTQITTTTNSTAIDLIYDPLSQLQYARDFKRVQQALTDGESYQINYTKRIKLRSSLDAYALYTQLKAQQPVSYSAFLPFKPMTVLSFSPELFFKKQGDTITVKPMKGTSKRSDDPNDDLKSYEFLRTDPKNKAENLIIVDLLRNDLARICDRGSIKVSKPFAIETYKSVYQMTSTISGKVDSNIPFADIIEHLFPCGSITGAPKKRTIEIIQQLEPPRGLYTGCIGYIMPNNDMCFSVAIRTLTQQNNELWHCGVGGGFTIQSTQDDEWQEMTTKVQFIKRLYHPQFQLIESMLYDKNGLTSCDLHLKRLCNSASVLHFALDIAKLRHALLQYCETLITANSEQYKLRVAVDYHGLFTITHQQLEQSHTTYHIELFICPEKIDSNNPLWQHKTDDHSTRGFYTQKHSQYIADKPNCELIFFNEQHHLTEARFYNIIIEIDGILYTPPVNDGLLPGIARAKLLQSEQIHERSISIKELKSSKNIYLINDLRGKIPCFLSTSTTMQEV